MTNGARPTGVTRPGDADPADTWHVYTDGSTRFERRQTFSGWAARAVQPETRQVRQTSGARPGGTSLDAEAEAILAGLRLVPGGAVARLYSDLELAALLAILESPAGEAARHHLRDLWAHPVARNSGQDSREIHHVARSAEQEVRQGDTRDGSGLANAVLAAQGLARIGQVDPPLTLHAPRHLPGETGPLQVRMSRLTPVPGGGPVGRVRVSLTLDLAEVPGAGRHEEEALRDALIRGLTPLVRGGLVELRVPQCWAEAAADATRGLGVVRVVEEQEPDGDGAA